MNDQNGYIPREVNSAMTEHLQGSLPAHLQQYVGPNRSGYVPRSAASEINKYMQNLPPHLRQYSGAYMEQSIVRPNINTPGGQLVNTTPHPRAPDPLRLGHSNPGVAQNTVTPGELPGVRHDFEPDNQQPLTQQPGVAQTQPIQSVQPMQPAPNNLNPDQTPAQVNPAASHYDFITNPEKPATNKSFFAGHSYAQRVGLITGGAIMLIIIVVALSSAFSSSGNTTDLINLDGQQQEIASVASLAEQNGQEQSTKNSGETIQLSMMSEQQQLTGYLSKHGVKVSPKDLAKDPSVLAGAAQSQRLSAAIANSDFDSVFKTTLEQDINSYLNALSKTYGITKNQTTRQLLKNYYNDGQLLLTQLKQPNTTDD